jgi:hypothetical protein
MDVSACAAAGRFGLLFHSLADDRDLLLESVSVVRVAMFPQPVDPA